MTANTVVYEHMFTNNYRVKYDMNEIVEEWN